MTKEQVDAVLRRAINACQQDCKEICHCEEVRDLAYFTLSQDQESVRSEARRDALEEAAKMAEMMFPEDADLKTNAIAAAIRDLAREDVHSTELRK